MAVGFTEGRFGDFYKLGPKIGQGHFGVVREVVEKSTGKVYAAKIILKSAGASESSRLRLQREVEIGLELSEDGSGMTRTVCAFQDEHRVYVVMEMCRGGTLADYIDRRRAAWAAETQLAREAGAKFAEVEAMRKARRERIEVEAGWVMGQLATALAHVHEHHVLHRDMKPENVLISDALADNQWLSALPAPPSPKDCTSQKQQQQQKQKQSKQKKLLSRLLGALAGSSSKVGPTTQEAASASPASANTVKIADFGLAERVAPGGSAEHGFVGSPAYVAPEVVQGSAVGTPADVWGLGVILYFLLSDGRLPFSGRSTAVLLRSIRKAEIDLNSPALIGASPEAKDVLRQLLAADPRLRPSAAEVAQMPWVQEQAKKRSAMLGEVDVV